MYTIMTIGINDANSNNFYTLDWNLIIMNITLALGGGGAKGNAHIGVIRRLEKENITIEAVAGTSFGGVVAVFVALTPALGRELWVTDGTALGTGLLRDIYPGDYPSTQRQFTRIGNQIVFSAEDEEHGLELWVTDGTYPGTTLLKDVAPGLASSARWHPCRQLPQLGRNRQ